MAIELDQTLNSVTTEVELDIGDQTNISDKTIYLSFNPAGGDSLAVELYIKPIDSVSYVPFVKSPFDLTVISFNSDCGGIGFDNLARVGKVKFVLTGAVDPASSVRLIITS
jgi:hypothetical protein